MNAKGSSRVKSFKKGLDTEDGKRRREETTIQLRKTKKSNDLSKRRQMSSTSSIQKITTAAGDGIVSAETHEKMEALCCMNSPVETAVFCSGANYACQLGVSNDKVARYSQFKHVNQALRNIVSIAAGAGHCLSLSEDGVVYSWGDNDWGQCGRCIWNPDNKMENDFDAFDVAYPIQIPERIIAVDAGANHSLTISSEGNCYFFGCYHHEGKKLRDEGENKDDPQYDQERKDFELKEHMRPKSSFDAPDNTAKFVDPPTGYQYLPIKIMMPEKVAKIACGATFNAAVLQSGRCVTWGLNLIGELGRMTEGIFDLTPREVAWFDADELVKSNIQRKVKDVACGDNHILIVAQDCSSSRWCVYSSGKNNYGQLGLGFESTQSNRTTDTKVLTRVTYFDDKNIALVAAGMYHSLCLDASGHNLYTFGRGDSGQLGNSIEKIEFLSNPKPVYLYSETNGIVKENPKIRSIACGEDTCMAVTETDHLYTWGCGEAGSLGQGRQCDDSAFPKKVSVEHVVHASGGSKHSIILCSITDNLLSGKSK